MRDALLNAIFGYHNTIAKNLTKNLTFACKYI